MGMTHKERRAEERRVLFDRFLKAARCGTFDSVRGPDGKVRARVWDRVCVPGHDEKDGQSTDFTLETLGQMVDNFVERGDPIPLDFNHQSNYAHINGQPAPALAWYGALAIVADGQVVKIGCAGDVQATGAEPGMDLSKDGLWAFRYENTELGEQLLPNFKLTSPTFTSEGTKRDGTPVGYCLAAVAATNTPWQGGTSITFQKRTTNEGAATMAKAKFAKFAGAADGADDAAIKSALSAKTAELAQAAMADEAFKYDEAAKELEDMAAEAASEPAFAAECAKMSAMAQKFRRFAKFESEDNESDAAAGSDTEEKKKFAGDDDKAKFAAEEEKAKMAKLEADKGGEAAKMAVMQRTLEAQGAELARLKAAEAAREAQAQKEREQRFEAFAERAIAAGYPKDGKADLIKFARTDFEGAQKVVSNLLPKSGAPAHLFGRLTGNGAPAGEQHIKAAREFQGPAKPREIRTPFGRFVEDDGAYADAVRNVAESKDPSTMAKVDKLIPGGAPAQAQMFNRLLAAQKIVRAEQPELAESAE